MGRSGRRVRGLKALVVVVLALSWLPYSSAWAHPGGTASDGCHYCRTNCDSWGEAWNERHCHGGGSSGGGSGGSSGSTTPPPPPPPPADTEPPVAPQVSADANGGSSTVELGVSGEAGAAAIVKLGDRVLRETSIPSSGETTTSINLEDGKHTLSVSLRDAAGNVSQSRTVSVTIDTTPPGRPSVSLEPAFGGRYNLVVSGENGARVEAVLEGPTSRTLNDRVRSGGRVVFEELELDEGRSTITVELSDAAKNVAPGAPLEFTVEHEAPDVPAFSIDASPGAADVVLEVEGTPLSVVSIVVDGPQPDEVELELDRDGTGSHEFALDDGAWRFSASAVDWRDLRSDSSPPINHTVKTSPPELAVEVDEALYQNGELAWSAISEEGATVLFRLLDADGNELHTSSDLEGSFTELGPDEYVLAVSATDRFGNVNSTEVPFAIPPDLGPVGIAITLGILGGMGYGTYRGGRALLRRTRATATPAGPPAPPRSDDRLG